MSFDGNLIHHLTSELNTELQTGRITKIYQISKYDLIFNISTSDGKKQLLISSSPNYSRLYITNLKHEKPDTPPTFCMFLRKQLEGGIILSIKQKENDRIIVIEIEKRNELGDLAKKQLIIEMMGRYSNIIVCDDENKILEAIKHQMPFDGNDRTLYPGAIYEYPQTDQINPKNDVDLKSFLSQKDNLDFDRMKHFLMGFSPIAIKEVFHILETSNRNAFDVIKEVLNNYNPTIIIDKKDHFYYNDLTHIKGDRKHFENINKLLDEYFYKRDSLDIIKQHSKDLIKFTNNYSDKLLNKIDKLSNELNNSEKMNENRVKGELIQANLHMIKKGDSYIECINYYTDQSIQIILDEKLTPIQNSEKYFKKYKKLKASIPHLHKQIDDAKIELKYINQIKSQIENASLKDIEEIKIELMNRKLIKRSNNKKSKNTKPNYEVYYDHDGYEIYVGKNNLQNQYITHKLAKHYDIWFHVKDAPGSHVVSKAPVPLSESTIRACANLAAYFSSFKHSSSVPIDYVEIRKIKKVPGKINSFVTYTDHKTIYIDPDEQYVMSLKKK